MIQCPHCDQELKSKISAYGDCPEYLICWDCQRVYERHYCCDSLKLVIDGYGENI